MKASPFHYSGSHSYRVVSCAKDGAITSHSNTCDRDIVFGYELMTALVLTQVPYSYIASTIAADELALVWMDDYIVDRNAMTVVALNSASTSIPYLYRAVFRAGNHPFALAMEGYSSNIACMTFKDKDRRRIAALDVEELDGMVTGSGKETFIRGYT